MKNFGSIRRLMIVVPVVAALIFGSCRKAIKVKLPEYKQKLVIEGSITTDEPAVVFLSFSVPVFGGFDFTHPENAFVKDAFVTVTDGTLIDTLKAFDPNAGYFYYGSKVIGQQGKTYRMDIVVNGKSYTAETYIHAPLALDSLYFKGERDTLGFIWAHITEPAGIGNQYRWFAKRLNKGDLAWAAPFNSVFDDKFVDGKDFHFAYDRGPQPNETQEFRDDPEAGWFKRGDTVAVKFCTIGRSEYNFWYSYYLNKSSNGNPFSAPSNIVSMFSGEDVIGGFFGYSPSYDTLVIPK